MAGDDRIRVTSYASLSAETVYEINVNGKPWFASMSDDDTRLALRRAKDNIDHPTAQFIMGAKGFIVWTDDLGGPTEVLKMIPEAYGDW